MMTMTTSSRALRLLFEHSSRCWSSQTLTTSCDDDDDDDDEEETVLM